MDEATRVAESSGMTRRTFVQASTTAAAALAAFAATGCAPNSVEETQGTDGDGERLAGSRDLTSGEWRAAACWHNCGGRCVNKALVKDGVVVRQSTDASHDDSVTYFQQRSCVRGHSQRKQVFAADRLKYPMKRKNWSPDAPNGDLRGRDEWERISWDDAFKYVAEGLKKVYDKYGPRSVLASHAPSAVTLGSALRPLESLGGYAAFNDSSSFGAYAFDVTCLGLMSGDYGASLNDRFDYKNADYLVFHACNPAWSQPGSPMYLLTEAKAAGVNFVSIDPSYTATAAMLDARWIPVRPGTDTVFMLGVAYEMIQLDQAEPGSVIDWDFLHNNCVGFDAESMPEGAASEESFQAYLLGEVDGAPKTAEWASAICGTPVEDIRWYAEVLGKNNKVTISHGYASARCRDAEDVPQMLMTLAAMGGHYGKPGHACGASSDGAFFSGPALVAAGDGGLEPIDVEVDDAIVASTVWQNIKDKKYQHFGMFYSDDFSQGEERDIDIHAIFYGHTAAMQTTPDLRLAVEVTRTMDFVCAVSQFLTTQAKYSDVVLPVTTEWERCGSLIGGGREVLFVYSQIVEPLYEAKTDQEIGYGIAQAMELDADKLYPLSEKQQFMNSLLGATVMEPNGKYVPLLTITDDDLSSWECEGASQKGKMDLATFLTNGCYQVERSEGDAFGYTAYEDFVADPAANPLGSASGKFEIHCQAKANLINGCGFSNDYKPYPTYRGAAEVQGFTNTNQDEPFVVYNPHYFRRSHTVLDNVTWLREAWSNPVFVSAADAVEKGIVSGDDVVVFNKYGKVVRKASVLENMMPGVVGLPHGAWIDLDENEEYDLGGADNVLCGSAISGCGVSGYNNYTCNFEKYTGTALPADCDKPQRIVEL